MAGTATRSRSFAGKQPIVREQWCMVADEQLRLLEALHGWQQGAPGRVVQLLSGGVRCGVETTVTHISSGLVMQQLVVGPHTDFPLGHGPGLAAALAGAASG